MVSADFIEETLQRYIELEKKSIELVDKEGYLTVKLSDFEKEKLKQIYRDRLELLNNIHFDLLE